MRYKYRVEFLVCQDDNTWCSHWQAMGFNYRLDLTNLTFIIPLLRSAFNLPGEYVHVVIHNVEYITDYENPLAVVLDALQHGYDKIEMDQLYPMDDRHEADLEDQLAKTTRAIEIIATMMGEDEDANLPE